MVDHFTLSDLTTELHMRHKMEIVDINQLELRPAVEERTDEEKRIEIEREREATLKSEAAKELRRLASYKFKWEKPVVPVVPAESEASKEEDK